MKDNDRHLIFTTTSFVFHFKNIFHCLPSTRRISFYSFTMHAIADDFFENPDEIFPTFFFCVSFARLAHIVANARHFFLIYVRSNL